jgi:hypothetical protein
MALRNVLILRKPPLRDAACGGSSGQGGCLEGRTALIQPIVNSFRASAERLISATTPVTARRSHCNASSTR